MISKYFGLFSLFRMLVDSMMSFLQSTEGQKVVSISVVAQFASQTSGHRKCCPGGITQLPFGNGEGHQLIFVSIKSILARIESPRHAHSS